MFLVFYLVWVLSLLLSNYSNFYIKGQYYRSHSAAIWESINTNGNSLPVECFQCLALYKHPLTHRLKCLRFYCGQTHCWAEDAARFPPVWKYFPFWIGIFALTAGIRQVDLKQLALLLVHFISYWLCQPSEMGKRPWELINVILVCTFTWSRHS